MNKSHLSAERKARFNRGQSGHNALDTAIAQLQERRPELTEAEATLIALERSPELYDMYAAENPQQFAPRR